MKVTGQFRGVSSFLLLVEPASLLLPLLCSSLGASWSSRFLGILLSLTLLAIGALGFLMFPTTHDLFHLDPGEQAVSAITDLASPSGLKIKVTFNL